VDFTEGVPRVELIAHEFKARQFTLAGVVMRTLCGHAKRDLENTSAIHASI
jgi:hypothetical protein